MRLEHWLIGHSGTITSSGGPMIFICGGAENVHNVNFSLCGSLKGGDGLFLMKVHAFSSCLGFRVLRFF